MIDNTLTRVNPSAVTQPGHSLKLQPIASAVCPVAYRVPDQQCKAIDGCLQLFGGYGYMSEYPIAQFYIDSRVQRIYGGTNEIMKELAARFM